MRSFPGGLADWVCTTQAPCAARAAMNRPARTALLIVVLLRGSGGLRGGRRSHPDDPQHTFLVLRAVVVNLLRGVDDEAAGRHRFEPGGIVVGAGVHPPRARND